MSLRSAGPNLEYCSIKLVSDPSLLSKLLPVNHRQAVGQSSLCYRYFHGVCSVVFVLNSNFGKIYKIRVSSVQTNYATAEAPNFSILPLFHSQCVKVMESINYRFPQKKSVASWTTLRSKRFIITKNGKKIRKVLDGWKILMWVKLISTPAFNESCFRFNPLSLTTDHLNGLTHV